MIRVVSSVGDHLGIEFSPCQTVVFDILRATTTMTVAFENGALSVRPAPSLESARELKKRFPDALLGGETGQRAPADFDLGNSPVQYTRGRVGGRHLILTTTNGTKALEASRESQTLFVASFRNMRSTLEAMDPNLPWVLFCSGREGHAATEDLLAAGALADLAGRYPTGDRILDRATRLWRATRADLRPFLEKTEGGRRLTAGGFSDDIPAAAQLDVASFAIRVDEGIARVGAPASL